MWMRSPAMIWSASRNRTQPVDHYAGYVAGVQVSWHLFDGLATMGRMNATRARVDAAEVSYDAVHRGIEADVLRAYRDLQRAEENIQTQTANVQLATESLQLATANFGLGVISQLELLQSQLDLTRAQTAELSARFDHNVALARLQRAMGSQFSNHRNPPGGTGRQMNRWTGILFALLVVLCATQTAVAQIEKQAQTYDLTLEDCLALAFHQNPDIRQLRAEVEHAMGTKVVIGRGHCRSLPHRR